MKNEKLVEATMRALRGKLSEVKGSSKTYTCIEDRQGGDFAVGKTMTAEEWGEEAYSWAYGDDWTDPEEPLLKNFKTEKDCLDFIQDMWEITIVPSDSPEAKEFLGEARSHKEDNEKVAPRTVKNALGNDVETRDMVDVSNPSVGNKSYHNEKGSQYWGTTEAEYASKRNKTGQKNEYGRDVYLAPFKNKGDWTIKADRMEPATATARYQYNKGQAEDAKERVNYYTKELKRVRSPYKKAVAQNQIDGFTKTQKEYDDKAHQIYQDMKDKQNKKVTEATTDVNENYNKAVQLLNIIFDMNVSDEDRKNAKVELDNLIKTTSNTTSMENKFQRTIVLDKNTYNLMNSDKFRLIEEYKDFGIYQGVVPKGYFKSQHYLITDNKITVVSESYNHLDKDDMKDLIDSYLNSGKFNIKAINTNGVYFIHNTGDEI